MHYMLGRGNGNGRASQRMYHTQCPDRCVPDHRIFKQLHRKLRETGSFHVTRHNAGRRRAVRELMVNVILFFWNRCYQNYCSMFQSPFVTTCDFRKTRRQPASLMCVLTF
ncbi:hypothetical protein TNCV_4216691 [Trichonephila clavipes]|nr:hypothetical protein TNCV_4216691 [Trichonephila clavipes]